MATTYMDKANKDAFRFDWTMGIILALLCALIVVPSTMRFMVKTRVLETQSNLELLRSRIELFRKHEGRVPHSLEELLTASYIDRENGARNYLDEIPAETITAREGSRHIIETEGLEDFVSTVSRGSAFKPGGWIYRSDTGEVYVNMHDELDRKWGKFRGEIPSRW